MYGYVGLNLTFITGDPKSEVYGYFTREGIFSGMVYTDTDTIHIEPSHRFGVNTSHNVSQDQCIFILVFLYSIFVFIFSICSTFNYWAVSKMRTTCPQLMIGPRTT